MLQARKVMMVTSRNKEGSMDSGQLWKGDAYTRRVAKTQPQKRFAFIGRDITQPFRPPDTQVTRYKTHLTITSDNVNQRQ